MRHPHNQISYIIVAYILLFSIISPALGQGDNSSDEDSSDQPTESPVSFSDDQVSVTFLLEKSSIDEPKSPSGPVLHKIKVKVTRHSAEVEGDITIPIIVSGINAGNSDFSSFQNTIHVSKDEIDGKLSVEKDIVLEIKPDSEAETGELIRLEIGQAKGVRVNEDPHEHYVTIKDANQEEEQEDDDLNPFHVSLGANFDFENAITSSFYANVQFCKPSLFHFGNKGGPAFGVFGRIYTNRFVVEDSTDRESVFVEELGTINDSTIYEISKSREKKDTKYRNYGFEGSLLWALPTTSINSSEQFSFNLILPEVATIIRQESTTYDYDDLLVDTVQYSNGESVSGRTKNGFFNRKVNEIYLGAGFILTYSNKYFTSLTIKPTTGFNWTKDGRNKAQGYYSVYIDIIESKIKLNLGAEVRGVYGSPRHDFAIYLSKAFDLGKLLGSD